MTWLVVPHYHRHPNPDQGRFYRCLEACLAAGHELCLHGYTHLDEGPPPTGVRQRFQRHIFTRSEGEFSALDVDEARRRLELGLEWFAEREWPVEGFVAPAWLLSRGTWQALAGSAFAYTTTLAQFHLLPDRQALWSPSLVYSSRNALLRRASSEWNRALTRKLRNQPLVRLSLHPPDVQDGRTTRHWQSLLETLLESRTALTKSQFARAWRSRRDSGGETIAHFRGRPHSEAGRASR